LSNRKNGFFCEGYNGYEEKKVFFGEGYKGYEKKMKWWCGEEYIKRG
jgi:hypothetical protein